MYARAIQNKRQEQRQASDHQGVTKEAAFKTILRDGRDPYHDTMQSDNENAIRKKEARILWDYNIETMGEPAGIGTPSGEMDLFIALRDPDASEFIKALKLEIHALISETNTLQPISISSERPIC